MNLCVGFCTSFPVSQLLHHRRALFCLRRVPNRQGKREDRRLHENEDEEDDTGSNLCAFCFWLLPVSVYLQLSLAVFSYLAILMSVFVLPSSLFLHKLSQWGKLCHIVHHGSWQKQIIIYSPLGFLCRVYAKSCFTQASFV